LLISGIISGLFSFSVVPTLVRRRTTTDAEDYSYFVGSVLLVFIVLSGCLSCLACFFTHNLLQILAPNLPIGVLAEATQMARISWVNLTFVVIVSYLVAVHNARKQFIAPVLVSVLPTLGTMTGMTLFASRLGVASILWGLLGGYLMAIPFLYVGVAKEIRFKLISINLWQDIQALFANAPLVLISMLCFTIYGTVDAIWASRLGPSNLSYLGYGQRLVISIGNIVILGPSTILTPYLAEKIALGEHDKFKTVLAKALRIAILFSTLLALVVSFLSIPLIRLLFERGAFDSSSTLGVASVLPGMLFGMVAMLNVVLIIKALHARGDIKVAANISIFCTVCYFGLSALLSQLIGLQGIVYAYAISWWFSLGISIWYIWKNELKNWLSPINIRFAICLLCGLVSSEVCMQLITKLPINLFSQNSRVDLILSTSITASVGVASFLFLTGFVFRMPELMIFYKSIVNSSP
jgi:putative peptidoglycan lipid II flippase